MSITRRASDRQRQPRWGTLAVLAGLAAVVYGASPAGSPGLVAVVPTPGPSGTAATPSMHRPPALPSATLPATPAPTPTPAPDAGTALLEPDLVLLGSATIRYVVGPANGDGANIIIPLDRLDGLVIKPGATFDFWTAVGEVSRRTGYRRGAVIVGHHIDPDGALAGGICTVSTALFDAAARAGLQITARTSHGGYLTKYPLGLDAAVAKGDGFRQTLAFRNDASEPIVVRAMSTPGIARVDLYGKTTLGRDVAFSAPRISHRQKARDRHVATSALARGQHRRVEDRSDGMTVVVTRTVRRGDGRILRRDRWVSVYRRLDGLVLDGTG